MKRTVLEYKAYLNSINIEHEAYEAWNIIQKKCENDIIAHLTADNLQYIKKVTPENLEDFLYDVLNYPLEHIDNNDEETEEFNMINLMLEILKKKFPKLSDFEEIEEEEETLFLIVQDAVYTNCCDILSEFDQDRILGLLKQNPHMAEVFDEIEESKRRRFQTKDSILKRIPDNYIDLYPAARKMKRRFILHIGPTNSGKTYHAVEQLKNTGDGIYLAPLRLLAYEQYEKLNQEGCPCNLITGEERIETPLATVSASTIEMADYDGTYQVAVIDEAQMIADSSRGGAWTAAILGIPASRIEICAAPQAKDLLVNLIQQCGDEYEIINYERKTPLIVENKTFKFPCDVQAGDALIVFSKRNVHAVASELQHRDIPCSILYGSLPYDVRHEEARRFSAGETKVIVSTDAIGMGMNLPIKRVVFLEIAKYDGRENRILLREEVKQISGRAGRLGKFNEGYVASCENPWFIKKSLESSSPILQKATIAFPQSLVTIDDKLSNIIREWNGIAEQDIFKKSDSERLLNLCEYAEPYIENKDLLYDLITMSFDENNEALFLLWQKIVYAVSLNGKTSFESVRPYVPQDHLQASDLPDLESAYKICDLMYAYNDKFKHDKEEMQIIMDVKNEISRGIIKILKTKKLTGRKCKYCGKYLPWNYPYGMCQTCHDNRYLSSDYYF